MTKAPCDQNCKLHELPLAKFELLLGRELTAAQKGRLSTRAALLMRELYGDKVPEPTRKHRRLTGNNAANVYPCGVLLAAAASQQALSGPCLSCEMTARGFMQGKEKSTATFNKELGERAQRLWDNLWARYIQDRRQRQKSENKKHIRASVPALENPSETVPIRARLHHRGILEQVYAELIAEGVSRRNPVDEAKKQAALEAGEKRLKDDAERSAARSRVRDSFLHKNSKKIILELVKRGTWPPAHTDDTD